MMKKLMAVLISAAMTFSLMACTATAPAAPAAGAAPEAAAPAAGAAPEAAAPAASADTITVKLGFAESEQSKHIVGYRYMTDKITEATNGLVVFDLYPSNSLGSERDLYEGCQLGTVDACIITNAVLTNFIPEASVLDQPFLFDDYDMAWNFIDGAFGDYLEEKALATGVHIMGWMDSGFRSMYLTKPVSSIDDLKGRKIRTMENEYHMAAYNALGAIATPMAFGDVFTGLQQGTIDGAENTIPSIVANNHYEICKYICNQPTHFQYQLLVFSDNLWNKIPEEYHEAVLAAVQEGCDYQRNILKDSVDEFREDLQANQGVTFFDLDLEQLKSLTQDAMKQFTFDPEALQLMQDELAKL